MSPIDPKEAYREAANLILADYKKALARLEGEARALSADAHAKEDGSRLTALTKRLFGN